MAQGERAPRLEARQVGGRQHAEHLPRCIDDHDVIGARSEHLDDRVHGDAIRPDLQRPRDDARDGAFGRHLARDDALAQDRVGEDRQILAVADEDRRRAVLVHHLGRAPDRRVRIGEDRRAADQVGDPDRPELRQRVDRVPGLHEAVPVRRREIADAGRASEDCERLIAPDQPAHGPLAGPDRERRREAAEQGWVAEALPGADRVDDLALVQQLDQALAHDEQMFRRRAVLEQYHVARLVDPFLDAARECGQLVRLQRVEGWKAGEELGDVVCVHRLH